VSLLLVRMADTENIARYRQIPVHVCESVRLSHGEALHKGLNQSKRHFDD